MIITSESHLDHGLTAEHVDWIRHKFGRLDAPEFFVTVTLPEFLPSVPCGLHGPAMGDEPIAESEVHYARRGEREYVSRLVHRRDRMVRTLTLIAGNVKQPDGITRCVLYTAFGGTLAPREPSDPRCENPSVSYDFWKQHALSAP